MLEYHVLAFFLPLITELPRASVLGMLLGYTSRSWRQL